MRLSTLRLPTLPTLPLEGDRGSDRGGELVVVRGGAVPTGASLRAGPVLPGTVARGLRRSGGGLDAAAAGGDASPSLLLGAGGKAGLPGRRGMVRAEGGVDGDCDPRLGWERRAAEAEAGAPGEGRGREDLMWRSISDLRGQRGRGGLGCRCHANMFRSCLQAMLLRLRYPACLADDNTQIS